MESCSTRHTKLSVEVSTMRALLLFLALAVGTSSGAKPSQKPTETPISLCRLLREAQQHDGSLVSVSGIYIRTEHGAILTDTGCDQSRPVINLRGTSQLELKSEANRRLVSLLKKRRAARVTISGEFHVAPKEHAFGPGGELYELEMTAIVNAMPAEDQASKRVVNDPGGGS
jgi:hypothetical protein